MAWQLAAGTRHSPVTCRNYFEQPGTALRCTTRRLIFSRPVSSSGCMTVVMDGSVAARAGCNAPAPGVGPVPVLTRLSKHARKKKHEGMAVCDVFLSVMCIVICDLLWCVCSMIFHNVISRPCPLGRYGGQTLPSTHTVLKCSDVSIVQYLAGRNHSVTGIANI